MTPEMGFNTQPPEGGWGHINSSLAFGSGFNTQPPEGGWITPSITPVTAGVSTHSRLKAAGGVGVAVFV